MRTLIQEALLILVIVGVAIGGNINKTTSSKEQVADTYPDQYDEFEEDEVLFSENKPCPRDCLCVSSLGSTAAKCNRLEVGTQKFGSDITDLIIENANTKSPIVLSDRIFKKLGLSQIVNIKIANSDISSISPTAFADLDILYSVNLSGNKIENLDQNTFASNKELYLVSLSNNPIVFPQMDSDQSFLVSQSIQELDLSKCNLTDAPVKIFSKIYNLTYINLSGNKLRILNPDLFKDLSELEEVDLSNNYLTNIPGNLFSSNFEMTTLNVGRNPINNIRGLSISELLTLNLNEASLKTVGPLTFQGMLYISNLNLSGNGITKIYDLAFAALTELNYLDISNNKIDTISSDIISSNSQLDTFKIANNILLKELPSEGFLCKERHFNIDLFDASGCSIEIIPDNFFKSMSHLTQLSLAKNKIYSLGSSLQKVPRLVKLDLSYNMIESLDKNIFANNHDIQKLNLAGNPIVTLSTEVFINNKMLNRLDLSSCQLIQLWENGDNHPENVLQNLQYLNVSNNQLTAVHYSELDMIKNLYTFDVSQNPLQCTADFSQLMIWLGNHNVSPAARDILMSNLKMEGHSRDNRYKWEFLAKQICGLMPTTTTTSTAQPQINIDSFEENILKRINETTEKDDYGDYVIDDEDEDDYEYEEDSLKNNKTKSDSNEFDHINEIHYDLGKDIIIPEVEEPKTISEKDIDTLLNDLRNDQEGGKTYEFEIGSDELVEAVGYDTSADPFLSRQVLLVVYVFSLFVLIVSCAIIARLVRSKFSRTHCTIVTMSSQNRLRNCGQVYQPLSEDLSEPRTPILKKHTIIDNMTSALRDSNPFHQKLNGDAV